MYPDKPEQPNNQSPVLPQAPQEPIPQFQPVGTYDNLQSQQVTPQQIQPTNQNVSNPEPDVTSAEYLDQISRPASNKNGPSALLLGIVAGVGVLTVILFVFMMLGSRTSSSDKLSNLYQRLQTLQSLSNTEQSYLKDTSLRATNSNLSLLLTNSIRNTESALGTDSIKKQAKSTIANEAAYKDKLLTDFGDAKLNVQLDSTYAREMAYQLSVLQSMMRTIYQSSKNSNTRKLLEETNSNLEPIQKSFSEFSASKQ